MSLVILTFDTEPLDPWTQQNPISPTQLAGLIMNACGRHCQQLQLQHVERDDVDDMDDEVRGVLHTSSA